MAGFVRSIFSPLPVDQQWLRYLKGHAPYDYLSEDQRRTLVMHRDSQETRDTIRRSAALVSSSLLYGLEASSARVDSAISRQTGILDSRLYHVQSTLSEGFAGLQDSLATGFGEVADSLDSGFGQIDDTMREGFGEMAAQLADLSGVVDHWGRRMDRKLRLQIQAQRIGNTLSLNLAELMRIPDIQKERQDHIEKGLTFFKNGSLDEEFYEHALERLTAAQAIEKTDYVALYHLGLIRLYTPQHLDLEKAGELLTRAGRYAAVESDPRAARLVNILMGDPSKPLREQGIDPEAVKRLAADAFALAAQSYYLRGMNDKALELFGRSLDLIPADRQTRLWKLRVLCLLGRGRDAAGELRPLIEAEPGISVQAAVDPDLCGSKDVQALLSTLHDEATAKLRSTIAACEPLLASQSAARGTVATMRDFLGKNSYLDALAGLKLAQDWRASLAGESLELLPFLKKEYEILTKLLPAFRREVEALRPRSGEGLELQKTMLGLISPPSTAGYYEAQPLLRERFQTLELFGSLLSRVEEGSDLAKALVELRSKILSGEIEKAAASGVTIGILVEGRPGSTKFIQGNVSGILAGLESWMETEVRIQKDAEEAEARSQREKEEARERSAREEYRRAIESWESSLRSARENLKSDREELDRAKKELRNASGLKKLFVKLGGGTNLEDRVSWLEESVSSAEKRVRDEEARKPVEPKARSSAVPQTRTASGQRLRGEGARLISYSSSTNPMVSVRGGSFRRGSDVTLSSFQIGKYPVTQGFYRAVTRQNPSSFTGGSDADSRPVEHVSWYDAVEFCNRVSDIEGLKRVYSGSGTAISADFSKNGYRLPTEAEWEYAARGGAQSKGYEYSGSNDIGAVAWYRENSGTTTHAVGTKAANELGLYDMSGNVWEWCWDWYDAYPSGSQTDPTGASSGTDRVLRGGSWYFDAGYCRSATRGDSSPESRNYFIGFRLVRRP